MEIELKAEKEKLRQEERENGELKNIRDRLAREQALGIVREQEHKERERMYLFIHPRHSPVFS